jgi:hypothetical protein
MWIEMTAATIIRSVMLTAGMVCFPWTSAGVAAPVDTAGAVACQLAGWSNDSDPAGLNIRAAPRVDAEIISRVPQPRKAGADGRPVEEAAEFKIIGSRNGWFLITGVKFVGYYSADGKDRAVFAGPGWVFADKVRFLINRPEVRGQPSGNAPILAKLRLETGDGVAGPDAAKIDHVFGCSGTFAEAAVHMEGQGPTRGWVTGICSNQVTTCP